jgi:hypothetical protein
VVLLSTRHRCLITTMNPFGCGLAEQVRTSAAAQRWLTDKAGLVGVDDVLDAVAQVEFPQ